MKLVYYPGLSWQNPKLSVERVEQKGKHIEQSQSDQQDPQSGLWSTSHATYPPSHDALQFLAGW